jgi:hypothetical protein
LDDRPESEQKRAPFALPPSYEMPRQAPGSYSVSFRDAELRPVLGMQLALALALAKAKDACACCGATLPDPIPLSGRKFTCPGCQTSMSI